MIETCPLQIGFFVDETPVWLAPTLIFFGLELLFIDFINKNILSKRDNLSAESYLGVYSFIIGLLFATAGFSQLQGVTGLLVLLLFAMGKVVEGAVVIKILIFIRASVSPSAGSDQPLLQKLKDRFVSKLAHRFTFALISIAFYLLVTLSLLYGPVKQTLLNDIALYWTIATFAATILGLSYKLSYAQEELGSTLILGLLLCVSGAEVYNYGIFNEITTVVIGTIGHLIGLLLALLFYILD